MGKKELNKGIQKLLNEFKSYKYGAENRKLKEINIIEAEVGCWYTKCCEHTLKEIKDEKELEEIQKEYLGMLETVFEEGLGAGLIYRFWETKEDALSDLTK